VGRPRTGRRRDEAGGSRVPALLLGPRFDALLARALERSPERRFATAEAFRAALLPFTDQAPPPSSGSIRHPEPAAETANAAANAIRPTRD